MNFKLSDKKLSDITTFRTNKLLDKILSESLIVRKFSILMHFDVSHCLPLLEKASLSIKINLTMNVDKISPDNSVYTVPDSYVN